METIDLLFHPVRLRILQAAHGDEPVTTADLATRLPDVAKATLYRQVAVLADAGMLETVREARVRGAVERHYRVRRDRATVDLATAATMTTDDHRRGFATVVAVLLAEFDAYLAGPGADPVADLVGYRQMSLWLDDDEKAALLTEILAAIRPRLANGPAQGRRRHLVTPVIFPAEPARQG